MAKPTSAIRGGHLIMMIAYYYTDGWRTVAKENFANLVKLRKSRTLNLVKFFRYTVVDKRTLEAYQQATWKQTCGRALTAQCVACADTHCFV